MKSYSQAGQDKFAWVMNGKKIDGTFLDIGCHDGHAYSNTLGLEELGWTGLALDIQTVSPIRDRRCPFVCADAITADFSKLLTRVEYDYLSLDVDEATPKVLEKIMQVTHLNFGVITIEHDFYRLGPVPRQFERYLLTKCGYELACSDVVIEPGPGVPGEGGPFEDWWVRPTFVDMQTVNRFRCHQCIGRTIVDENSIR